MDRIVAVVDDDPILRSDVEAAIGLGLVQPQEGESRADLERRALDEIIIVRLRTHEIDRFGFHDIPLAEVEAQFDDVRARFPSEAAFQEALDQLGMTETHIKELLARQLMVMRFVEERLGPRVFVSLDAIRDYYEDVLVPEMERRGEPVPELSKVREQIRSVLREERLNEEIDEWTRELVFRADISDFLETEPRDLPPVVE